MQTLLTGTRKHGWEIDIEEQSILLYHPLSFIEKVRHHPQTTIIPFMNIQSILVGWNNIPSAYGADQHHILLTLKTNDNKLYDFEGLDCRCLKELFREMISILLAHHIVFDDPFLILDNIMNTDERVWEILHRAELMKRQHNKEKSDYTKRNNL